MALNSPAQVVADWIELRDDILPLVEEEGLPGGALDAAVALAVIQGSGGGGSGGITPTQTRDAVRDGIDLSTDIELIVADVEALQSTLNARLPTPGTKTAANSISTTDATPPLSIIATPHGAGGVILAAGAAAPNVNPVVVDLNSLVQRGEFSIGFTIAGNGTSPGAGTLILKWAYSSENNPTPDAAFVAGFVAGSVNSLSASIVASPNQSLRGVVRDLALARYLYLWIDRPIIATSATLTVITRLVQT